MSYLLTSGGCKLTIFEVFFASFEWHKPDKEEDEFVSTDDALNMVKGASNYKVNVFKICQKKVVKEVVRADKLR